MNYPDLALDHRQFDETRNLAGDKFTLLLGFFLEDSSGYLTQLRDALHRCHTEDTARLAHTLKSSARQFGFTAMAEPARLLEEAARHRLTPMSRQPLPEGELGPLAVLLGIAIEANQQALRRYLDHPQGALPSEGVQI